MCFPRRYNQSTIIAALKSRRGYLRNSIIKNIPVFTRTGLGCVFVTMDELTEHSVRQNIRMCTRKFKSYIDCSPISKDDYEQSVEVASL